MSTYVISALAEQDLLGIITHIEATSPQNAELVLERLLLAMSKLARTPHLAARQPDWTSESVRFWSARPFLIMYDPDSEPVSILAILHAARDLPEALKDRPSP